MNNATVLCCQNLQKYFQQGQHRVDVLSDVNFSVAQGERVAIIGNSGAGKSTLLQLLGGLDKPNAGEVIVADQVLSRTADAERGRLRNRLLGFIYQFHHLLPEFSALENVAMPLRIRGVTAATAMQQAQALLERVGLAERITHRPAQLSGGERQRAAVARALVTKPACVLADEPTGNLDRHNAEQVFNLMLDMNQELHTSLVMVTHDHRLAQRMDSIWLLQDGMLSKQTTSVSQSSSLPVDGDDAPRQ